MITSTRRGKEATTPKSSPERLIADYNDYDDETMMDLLSMAARDIEDAMLQCGAKPGKDYTYLDLFRLAVDFCASGQKTGKK